MYRLISKDQADRIFEMLIKELQNAEKALKGKIEWKPLPEKKESKAYAVDGSQGKARLSGTIIYTVSSFAFGNGKSARLVYTNAMTYNHGISDQIIRLQMETLENKLGALVGSDEHMILMDGTLTGSLTRPPVYPESVKGITTLLETLKESKVEELIKDFIERLDEHYINLEKRLNEERELYNGVILTDDVMEEYSEFYKAMEGKEVVNYDGALKRLRDALKAEVPRSEIIKIAEELDEYVEPKTLTLEEAKNTIHVVLGYLEYLHSLEKLLQRELIYLAKSFYNRKITSKLGVSLLDVPFIDAYLLRTYGEEAPGYCVIYDPEIAEEKKKIAHRLPRVLRKYFPTIQRFIESGVPSAYIRTMKGGVIYLLQSNISISDELIAKLLWHESNGYIRPLQKAHEGVKIEQRAFKVELEALMNYLKKKNKELRVFVKYGRSPLE
ncbi:DNA double-strand break repair nuclease NurA [Thermococcus aggregans]|uniref:DNA double-strand break repair nuclease NurA n=1 Tax=Thermococcus aggregans TaxID=110163 RepID=A0A9E7MVX6_THEAG|nr:DNA double-strand break repair nuclease NurA [Thermococcus aggregans]USS39931.1 DNA double-strand break repair nuclease NurA [Thermococcus aggregans]